MKRIILFAAVLLLVVVNVSSLATIGYHRWCRYREGCSLSKSRAGVKDLYEKLSLSAGQMVQMDSIRHSFTAETEKTAALLQKERVELVDALEASQVDEGRIQVLHGRIDSLQARLQGIVIKSIMAEKEILTPEQKKHYFSIIRERMCVCAVNRPASGLDPIIEGKTEMQCPKSGNNENSMKGGECE